MDRQQHQRYLTYLKKFEYFGRGRAKLDATQFAALDTEARTLGRVSGRSSDDEARHREVLALLLRD
jgi:hypothetical protein